MGPERLVNDDDSRQSKGQRGIVGPASIHQVCTQDGSQPLLSRLMINTASIETHHEPADDIHVSSRQSPLSKGGCGGGPAEDLTLHLDLHTHRDGEWERASNQDWKRT